MAKNCIIWYSVEMSENSHIWYVVVRKESHLPLLIYTDKDRADMVAHSYGLLTVPVSPIAPVGRPQPIPFKEGVIEDPVEALPVDIPPKTE